MPTACFQDQLGLVFLLVVDFGGYGLRLFPGSVVSLVTTDLFGLMSKDLFGVSQRICREFIFLTFIHVALTQTLILFSFDCCKVFSPQQHVCEDTVSMAQKQRSTARPTAKVETFRTAFASCHHDAITTICCEVWKKWIMQTSWNRFYYHVQRHLLALATP